VEVVEEPQHKQKKKTSKSGSQVERWEKPTEVMDMYGVVTERWEKHTEDLDTFGRVVHQEVKQTRQHE
jgi:hypothetical protein